MPDLRGQYTACAVLAALAVPAYIWATRAYRARLVREQTATIDLLSAGQPRAGGKLAGTAVICGGSIAGLMSARVCSDHFERVVVVEPEAWALSPAARDGPLTSGTRTVETDRGATYTTYTHKRSRVYQYLGYHVYQSFLTVFLRALFSGLDAELKARNVLLAPGDYNVRFNGWPFRYPYAEYEARGEDLPLCIFATRRTLESTLRSLVLQASPNVEYVLGTVTDLKLSEDGGRVTSVTARTDAAGVQTIPCDMFVDCSGNAQAGLKFLTRAIPSASADLRDLRASYDPKMYYSGIEYPVPPGFDEAMADIRVDYGQGARRMDTRKNMHYFTWGADPRKDYRTFFISRFENGLTLGAGGWASETPVNLEEMRTYLQAIKGDKPVPEFVHKIVDLFEPVADKGHVVEVRINSCSRVFYERVARVLPSNFVALGDATMRLNPRFGEGITKSAVGAATLDGALRSVAAGPLDKTFGRTFFARLAKRTQGLWEASKATDYGAETTTPVSGETRADGAFRRWYNDALVRVNAKDDAVASTFWHVSMFMAPGALLGTPGVMLKVFWEAAFPTRP